MGLSAPIISNQTTISMPNGLPANPILAGMVESDPHLADVLRDLTDHAADLGAKAEGARLTFDKDRERYETGREQEIALRANKVVDASGRADEDWQRRMDAKVRDTAERRRVLDLSAERSQPLLRQRDIVLDIYTKGVELLLDINANGGKVKRVAAKPLGNKPEDAVIAASTMKSLREQRDLRERAPVPLEDAIETVTAEIEAVAANGLKVVLGANGRPLVRWPLEEVHAISTSAAVPAVVDAAALIASLMPDALIAEAKAQLEAIYRDVPLALNPLEKAKVLASIDQQILDAERVEAATVWAARKAGHDVAWRKDINIKAVLGIA